MADSMEELRTKFEEWKSTFENKVLKLNLGKTKVSCVKVSRVRSLWLDIKSKFNFMCKCKKGRAEYVKLMRWQRRCRKLEAFFYVTSVLAVLLRRTIVILSGSRAIWNPLRICAGSTPVHSVHSWNWVDCRWTWSGFTCLCGRLARSQLTAADATDWLIACKESSVAAWMLSNRLKFSLLRWANWDFK